MQWLPRSPWAAPASPWYPESAMGTRSHTDYPRGWFRSDLLAVPLPSICPSWTQDNLPLASSQIRGGSSWAVRACETYHKVVRLHWILCFKCLKAQCPVLSWRRCGQVRKWFSGWERRIHKTKIVYSPVSSLVKKFHWSHWSILFHNRSVNMQHNKSEPKLVSVQKHFICGTWSNETGYVRHPEVQRWAQTSVAKGQYRVAQQSVFFWEAGFKPLAIQEIGGYFLNPKAYLLTSFRQSTMMAEPPCPAQPHVSGWCWPKPHSTCRFLHTGKSRPL